MGAALGGLGLILYGLGLLSRGVIVYVNQYRLTLYSPGTVATGALLVILAFVPDSVVTVLVRRKKATDDPRRPRSRHKG